MLPATMPLVEAELIGRRVKCELIDLFKEKVELAERLRKIDEKINELLDLDI